MLKIAEEVVQNPEVSFVICSSRKNPANPELGEKIQALACKYPNFCIAWGIDKVTYYRMLARASVQLNTSLQDYVSWTLLEALSFGCQPVYPDYRSFPEILPKVHLYRPWSVKDAVDKICQKLACKDSLDTRRMDALLRVADVGRLLVPRLILHPSKQDVNVYEACNYKP
jgi:hypothetical protein